MFFLINQEDWSMIYKTKEEKVSKGKNNLDTIKLN